MALTWTGARSCQSDVAPLRSVIMRSPVDAFRDADHVASQWRELGYTAPPDVDLARREFDALLDVLGRRGVEVGLVEENGDDLTLDSIYVRDAAVVCERGVILTRMGKEARAAEPAALSRALADHDIPIAGRIEAPGTVEGGDCAWVDESTLAVGRGYRTNDAGIAQLREILGGDADVLEVPLPHFRGPSDVFHLMSIYSPIAEDLALVHSPLMPVPFREALLERGVELVEVDPGELDSLGCNALAIAPRVCLLAEGNPVTASRLRAAGVEVIGFHANEICAKGSGGPTCLTRPLHRG